MPTPTNICTTVEDLIEILSRYQPETRVYQIRIRTMNVVRVCVLDSNHGIQTDRVAREQNPPAGTSARWSST
jgi:hypothetical protein